jgi:YesN/AraC family two-component response regulator
MIRVLIVDDQALMRAGFRALLDAEEGIEVVGEAADGRQGLELARRHTPDVALIDVQMPVMTGIEATREIADDPRLADVHVVILTNYGLDEVRLRRPARRGRRIPPEGHRTGRAAPGHRGRRPR